LIESQNIEWKQNWHDDYLKWVCGFANAFGGKIFIGIDDNGNVTGLKDYKNLLEHFVNVHKMFEYVYEELQKIRRKISN
jgi:ATP-dependent DNA helicase RecG